MTIGLVAIPGAALAQTHAGEPATREIGHVRTRNHALRTVIESATEQSATFRRMVDTINASDGIVYVEPGVCRDGVRACLVKVASAGPHRFVFVKVDVHKKEHELMASIGHELRHAVEVLSDPGVRDQTGLYFLYKSKREHRALSVAASTFETTAAIEAGQAVADEIRRFQRAK